MNITRTQIADEARKLIGTPYIHQGRSVESGIDCVGVIVVVANNLNYWDGFDYIEYHSRPDPAVLLREMRDKFDEITVEESQEGDIILLRLPKDAEATHVGILVKGLYEMTLIHALRDQTTAMVVEEPYRRRKKYGVCGFRFRGVKDE